MAAPGTDIALSESRIESYRNFANKIWNAARFLFFNLEKAEARGLTLEELAAPEVRAQAPFAVDGALPLVHRWIWSRLARRVTLVNDALREFRFHEAAHEVYHFFWGDFCDWYIEWLKPQLAAENVDAARAAWRNLFAVFESALRLLHPFMPFLTEELWQRLPQHAGAASIALADFPAPPAALRDEEAEQRMAALQEIITAARNIRAELKIDAKTKVPADFGTQDQALLHLIASEIEPVTRLATLSALNAQLGALDGGSGVTRHSAQFDLRMQYTQAVDLAAEAGKLRKELERLSRDIESRKQRLADEAFRSRAPEKVIRDTEAMLAERTLEHQKISERLAQLESP
jgi:valyl-tRNA synthetase